MSDLQVTTLFLEEQHQWETAWRNYIHAKVALEEAQMSVRAPLADYNAMLVFRRERLEKAKAKLRALDPDFTARVLGF